MNALAPLQDPVTDRSPEGKDMPTLPPGWTLRESAAFVFLACALQGPAGTRAKSGLQKDFEAARSQLEGICLNIHPHGSGSEAGMLMASRFFESLLNTPHPGNAIALEASRHVAELSKLGMETTHKWFLPTVNNLAGGTGTEPIINETARDIARHVWGSATEAVQIVESGRSVSYDKAFSDMGTLLEIQARALNWRPDKDLSWESSRRIVSPGIWDQVRNFFSN